MNIYEKISAIMESVQYLSKDTKISYKETHYKAVSEEKVTSAVREQLIKQKLVIYPIEQYHKKEGNISTVDVKYRIVNAENPEEYIEVVSSGTGFDTQDKGVGKAMTYAYKYMLLRTFAIPTGEDPDKVSSAELTDQVAENAQAVYVNQNHIASLKAEAQRIGLTNRGLLMYAGVTKFEDITMENYKTIMDELTKKPTKEVKA